LPVGQSTGPAHLKILAEVRFVLVREARHRQPLPRQPALRVVLPQRADVVMGKAPTAVEAVCS